MKKGLCSRCGKHRWLLSNYLCQTCARPIAPCARCQEKRKLHYDSLCNNCHQHRLVSSKLLELQSSWLAPDDYTRYIFELYFTYVQRYKLRYCHLHDAIKLSQILIQHPPKPILSWTQIRSLSERDQFNHRESGCAWRKIGIMLQELGVLNIRSQESSLELQTLMATFDSDSMKIISPFLDQLKSGNRSHATLRIQLYLIRSLLRWLQARFPVYGLLHVNQFLIQNYMDHLRQINSNPKFLCDHFFGLRRFYRWCVGQKLMTFNPFDNLKVSQPVLHLKICSPEQIKKLQLFVQNPKSPPEDALMICLVLFFGFTPEDLALAQIEPHSDQSFNVVLHRKPRSRGRLFFNREQVLRLPTDPSWFFHLQCRFTQSWIARFSKIQQTYPRSTLFLPRAHRLSSQPMSPETIQGILKKATVLATGIAIPSRVLRQTCGHLYATGSDASALTHMGWAPRSAFPYTWMPRTLWRTTNSSSA